MERYSLICEMSVVHVMSLSTAAAEPWPEKATLYQPLKGKKEAIYQFYI